jgi:hypothetical protein
MKFAQAIIRFLPTHFMKKFFLLTSMVVFVAASFAQQVPDTAGNQQPPAFPVDDSLFVDFSCALKNTNTVELRWKAAPTGDGDYFIVERSSDNNHYETVGAIKIADSIAEYKLADNSPLDGTGLYRVKYVGKSGRFAYSRMTQVIVPGSIDLKFYPNPADKLLIVRTSHTIDLQVLDAVGTLRLQKQLQPGLQIINIAFLEKGTYVINISDKESNKVISEQLLKN